MDNRASAFDSRNSFLRHFAGYRVADDWFGIGAAEFNSGGAEDLRRRLVRLVNPFREKFCPA